MNTILVLDIGTTSMRGILYDLQGNKLCVKQVPTHPIFGNDGTVSEKASDWSDITLEIMRDISSRADVSGLKAVSVTSARTSITPVDADGTPLMHTIMWQDRRNASICRTLSAHNALCFTRTGARVNAVFSGSKMTWVRRNRPDVYDRTYKFLNIPELIVYQMTGEFCSDYTYASRTGLMDIRKKTWDPDMLALYEVEAEKLCRLIEPGDIAGYVTKEFSEQSGIPEGVPVLHCGGDQQCAAVGQNVTEEGYVSIVSGTGGFLTASAGSVPENLRDDAICNCASIRGTYIIEANILTCSAAFDWFCHEIYGMEKTDYAFTEAELSKEAGVTDCIVIPYFSGRGTPDFNASAKASFHGVTLATRRSEMFKAMLESIYMELDNQLENISKYVDIRHIGISGGMTASEAVCQLQADVYGKPVYRSEDKESTALGAFLVTLVSLGYYQNINEAGKAAGHFQDVREYLPDPEKHILYAGKRSRMNRIYQALTSSKNEDERNV